MDAGEVTSKAGWDALDHPTKRVLEQHGLQPVSTVRGGLQLVVEVHGAASTRAALHRGRGGAGGGGGAWRDINTCRVAWRVGRRGGRLESGGMGRMQERVGR